MEIVELLIDVDVYKGLKLRKDRKYVMGGAVMNQLMRLYPGGVNRVGNFESKYNKLSLKNVKEGDSVFLFRSGGIGDVMFMLPLVKYLKKQFKVEIKIATSPMYGCVLENNPFVDKVVQMPFEVFELSTSEHHLMFEGVIEDSGKNSQVFHAVDLFLNEAGIDFKQFPNKNKVPELFISKEERNHIGREIGRLLIDKKLPKIGIQIESSSPIRTYPPDKMIVLMKKLMSNGFTVFAFGGKRQEDLGKYLNDILVEEKNFVNLVVPGKSLRDSIVYASFMDCVVASDSAFIHVAGALGIPVVGIYGCFPSMLRMKYYKNAIGIDCGVICAPSFIHGHAACVRGYPSPCFSVISPDDILNAVFHLLGGKKINFIYPRYNEFVEGELIDSPFNVLKKG